MDAAPTPDTAAFDSLDAVLDREGPAAALETLIATLSARGEARALLDALLLKARHELGLPPIQLGPLAELLEPLRSQYEDRYIEALNELGATKLREGAYEESLVLFRSLEAVDAFSEAAAVGIMRAYMALNDPGAAARHFRRFRQVLKDELDEEPSERLLDLYKQAGTS